MVYKYYGHELCHHGILGMKWGKTNGPPYPLNESDKSAAEKKAAQGLSKKDTKWVKKNSDKITAKATKSSSKELKKYSKELLKSPNAVNKNGKLSAATINAYNKKMAELMNEQVADLTSPSGKVVQFVAKRGEVGVYMALADAGYDMSKVKNGVWSSGRIAYKSTTLNKV